MACTRIDMEHGTRIDESTGFHYQPCFRERAPTPVYMVAGFWSRYIGRPVLGSTLAVHPARRLVGRVPQQRQRLPASRMKATVDKLKQQLHGNGVAGGALGVSVRTHRHCGSSNCGTCCAANTHRAVPCLPHQVI